MHIDISIYLGAPGKPEVLIATKTDIQNINPDWDFLFIFAAFAMTGIFIGIYISRYFNDRSLKKIFGWFVLTMALFILTKEVLF